MDSDRKNKSMIGKKINCEICFTINMIDNDLLVMLNKLFYAASDLVMRIGPANLVLYKFSYTTAIHIHLKLFNTQIPSLQ